MLRPPGAVTAEQHDTFSLLADGATDKERHMRVVVLTHDAPRGLRLVRTLTAAGVTPATVVLDRDRRSTRDLVRSARTKMAQGGVRVATERLLRRAGHAMRRRPRSRVDLFRAASPEVHEVPDANGDQGAQLLHDLAPDVVALGPARILQPHVIGIPRIGVLNAHPGLLPAYRGVDVVPWAIHNGDPVGATVHFVDAGIDTGPIVAREQLPVLPDDTLASLRRRAHHRGIDLLARTVVRLRDGGTVPVIEQRGGGRTYHRMPQALRQQVEHDLRHRRGAQDPTRTRPR